MPNISKDYLITIGMAVVMLIFWFAFAQIRWLIVLVSSIMLGLFISHLFIAFVNNLVQRQYAFLNRQLRVHLDIPETDMFSFRWVYPSLQGEYLRRRIQIYTTTQSVGDRDREAPFTTVSVDASFGGRSFSIRPEALGKRFTKFFYNKKRITDERAFDRKFDVNGDDLEYVGGLLDGAVREILSQGILSRESYLEFNNGKFSYTEQTVINTGWERRRFEKIILVMYMIAKKMEQGGRPKPLPERKPKDVLPPELSELLEEEYTPQKKGKQSEMDFDMNMDDLDFEGLNSDMDFEEDDFSDFPDEQELESPSRRLENEKEGTRQLDLFEEAGFPSSRKLDTSDEDLFRDGVEDGGKLSEEGIDSKKEKKKDEEKKKEKTADQPKKEEKQKPKPAPQEEPIESLDMDDFDLNFGGGDEDLSGLDIDLDNLDDMDFNESDLGDLDDMDFDMNDLDGMDLGDMDFDDSDFDMDGFDDDMDDIDFDDLFKK